MPAGCPGKQCDLRVEVRLARPAVMRFSAVRTASVNIGWQAIGKVTYERATSCPWVFAGTGIELADHRRRIGGNGPTVVATTPELSVPAAAVAANSYQGGSMTAWRLECQ